jgi:hypothetical protein
MYDIVNQYGLVIEGPYESKKEAELEAFINFYIWNIQCAIVNHV